ncbi:hypothetical protein [Streptomyces sp. NPDC045470]
MRQRYMTAEDATLAGASVLDQIDAMERESTEWPDPWEEFADE